MQATKSEVRKEVLGVLEDHMDGHTESEIKNAADAVADRLTDCFDVEDDDEDAEEEDGGISFDDAGLDDADEE